MKPIALKTRGISLAESILALGMVSMLLVVLGVLLQRSTGVWRKTSETLSASNELRKAQVSLTRDLSLTSPAQTRIANTPASLMGIPDSTAIWFLQAVDPNTNQPVRLKTGGSFWQRNIVYYARVPLGDPCKGGAGASGLEERCPHKVLIRKEVDLAPATSPSDEATIETLIPDAGISTHLDRPAGSALPAGARIVATGLLGFRVTRGADPNAPGEFRVEVLSADLGRAHRSIRVGQDPMGSFTLFSTFAVFPANP